MELHVRNFGYVTDMLHIDGLVQEKRNYIADALE